MKRAPKVKSLPCLREKHNDRVSADSGPSDRELGRSVLYREHQAAVYSRCRKLLADKSAAEDATHEVFARAFRHLDAVQDPDDQRRWLYRVATNYCLNQLRDQKRHSELLLQFEAAPCHDLSATLAARDFAVRLTRALPDEARCVAWLWYVDELDQHEVAELLGISRRTVVNRLATFRLGVRRAVNAISNETARAGAGSVQSHTPFWRAKDAPPQAGPLGPLALHEIP